jgi:hypothetical protein
MNARMNSSTWEAMKSESGVLVFAAVLGLGWFVIVSLIGVGHD